ncbi:hypothetical protein [Jiangella rhizosphaerae]|uniref:Tetratricopeptide repeat protein n=1 Tax=Jiangella rhizosphaerae TaxID=2293569 RepID=A0A418KTD0_9ACTN|nr:hypothetical protein [Jiangella rhizosphaerae]RIQ29611.1 hypothetical protein DY240_08120 [Jiangella rhizosphaerae]
MTEPSPGTDPRVARLVGVRATRAYGPEWRPWGRRFNDAALALEDGRPADAETILREVLEATVAAAADDGEALDLRSRVLHQLSAVADDGGDLAGALRLADECLAACRAAEVVAGDAYGTAATRAAMLVNRSQTLEALGRSDAALADLDDATALVDDLRATDAASLAVLVFTLHNSRGAVLTTLGRYEEAWAEIGRALAVAQESEPRLAGAAHTNLAVLADRTGDQHGADAHLRLAADLHEATGDRLGSATVRHNLARRALRRGDLDQAEQAFAAAQDAYERQGRPALVAGCQLGRAAVALRRARPRAAQRLLTTAAATMEATGDTSDLIECLLLLGDVTAVVEGFAAGDEVYLAARERCVRLGLGHQTARVDIRRAMVVAASTRITPRRKERLRRRESALGLVLPAALATEAIRHRFAVGPVRERWARVVAAPAMVLSFDLVTKLGWTPLAFELVEHASATVALTTAAVLPELDEDALAAQAGSELAELATGEARFVLSDAPAPDRLALPPRLRMLPEGDSVLDGFIAAAEERYGFPVRSAEVVPAW